MCRNHRTSSRNVGKAKSQVMAELFMITDHCIFGEGLISPGVSLEVLITELLLPYNTYKHELYIALYKQPHKRICQFQAIEYDYGTADDIDITKSFLIYC